MGMGQVVQITINVTDGNAAEAVQQVVAQLNAIGPAGAKAGVEAGAGLDKVSEHSLSARENVKLLNEDLGLRIPRAMQAVIGQSQLLSGAIGMLGPGLIAIGAADILAHMGESVYNLYEKYISLSAAQDEFLKTQRENKDKDFINVHSIETARQRIDDATAAVTNLRTTAEGMSSSGWADAIGGLLSGNLGKAGMGVGEIMGAHDLADASAKSAGQSQEMTKAQNGLFHQSMLQQIESDHAGDSALKGQAKITAELQKQLDINKEKQQYLQVQESQAGNMGASGSGDLDRTMADAAAHAKAHAAEIEQQRTETNQIIGMQNEAVNAGLEGNALRAAKEQQTIDAITQKFKEGEIQKQTASMETAAVQMRFAAEAAKLQEQLDEQTKKMADEAAQAGLKGLPQINAQLGTRLDSINTSEDKAVGKGGVETTAQRDDFASQRYSEWQSSNQKIVEAQTQFNEKIQSLTQSADDAQLAGYARVEAEERKKLDSLSKDYEEWYGKDRSQWAGYQQSKTQIEADADRQMQQLHQKTMEQIAKEEEQTARLSLPAWQQSMMAIEDSYKDRLREVQQDVKQHVMTEQEGADAVTAAWNREQVELQKNAEQTRDKLASTLGSFFSNPAQFIEKRAMDTAFQLMANDMMSVLQKSGAGSGMLQWLFGMGPEMNTSTNPLSAFTSAIGGTHGSSASSGITLSNAGTTLLSAGNIQMTAANSLLSAATSLQSATGTMSFGGGTAGIGSGGMGDFGMLGDTGSNTGALGSAGSSFLSGGSGSFTTAAGNSVIDASSLGPAGTGSSSSLAQAGAGTPGKMGAYAGMAGGALMAGTSIYSAYQNSDPLGGAMGGAMGGMEAGAALGSIVPGLGTVVGGAIGAVVGGLSGLFAGIFGDQGQGKAQDLDKNTITPGIVAELQQFNNGTTGYQQAAQYLQQLQITAQSSTRGWGNGANNWFTGHILPEIQAAQGELDREEKGGRSLLSMSAAQYHTGGTVGDFGDLATGPGEGFAKLLADEFVVQPMAARSHSSLLNAVNTGNVSYSNSVQPRMPASAAAGGAQITITAWDGKSVDTWLRNGGATKLRQAGNMATQQYGGQGVR